MKLTGGYWLIKRPLLKSGVHKHTAELPPDCLSPTALDALNAVQATPWQINDWINQTMHEAWDRDMTIGSLPQASELEVPQSLPDDEWQALSKEAQADVRYQRMKVWETNAKAKGKRESFMRKLEVADTMAGRPIWFPHFMDFRTRMYPYPQDLNPQGDDICKSLLEFGEALPLGKGGLYWLAIKVANCAGQDKLPIDERYSWTMARLDELYDSVLHPLDGSLWWASPEHDEPWGLLATARELVEALDSDNAALYLSRQPIPLDGSTNGLQHLSLLGRDAIGATKTNCSSDPKRYDLYTEVADAVKQRVSIDAAAGNEMAHEWIDLGIGRKTVKRAVMTTPYGVTSRGIRDQLMADGHVNGSEHKGQAASYMRDRIVEALTSTVEAAALIMGWFQDVAGELALQNKHMEWSTPSGCKICQSYNIVTTSRIRTLLGSVRLQSAGGGAGIDPRRQRLAASPNVIHSFDAAHLQRTVSALSKRHGIRSFAVIHDSYAVHASNTPLLAAVLRLEACDMYKADWLDKLYLEFCEQADDPTAIPPPPVRGTFDVEQVKDAPFFFS